MGQALICYGVLKNQRRKSIGFQEATSLGGEIDINRSSQGECGKSERGEIRAL